MNGKKDASAAVWQDPDDAPELTDAFFEEADEFVGEKLIRRGRSPEARMDTPAAGTEGRRLD